MNSKTDEILTGVLGQLEGTFEPAELTGQAWQADWQTRKDYFDSGRTLLFKNPGHGATERQAVTRALSALVDAGLVVSVGSNARIGLSEDGYARARMLCGLPSLDDALCGLDALVDPARDSHRWSDGWLAETSLCGLPAYTPGVVGKSRVPAALSLALVDTIMPLFVGGLAVWRTCNCDALFLYKATPEGVKQADARKRACTAKTAAWKRLLKRPASPVSEAYERAWQTASSERQTARPMWPTRIDHQDPVDAPEGTP